MNHPPKCATFNSPEFLAAQIHHQCQTASWGEATVGAGPDGAGTAAARPDAIANCRPLRCPDCRTKATWVAANAAASCLTKLPQKISPKEGS